jgi:GH25 family lysozyme M1 (1,4-beta-N-acetylmuramidase)
MSTSGFKPKGPAYAQGLTVYHWAPVLDITKVRAAGYSYIRQKATEGTALIDDSFTPTLAQCHANNFPILPFHFFHPSIGPVEQADFFYSVAKACTLGPSADFEDDDKEPAQAIPQLAAFLTECHRLWEVWPDIYTNPSFWQEHYTIYVEAQNRAGQSIFDFSVCPLSIANYGVQQPGIPHPWPIPVAADPALKIDEVLGWTYWQVAEEIPGVPGVSGNPDYEVFNGSASALPLLLKQNPVGADDPNNPPADAVARMWRTLVLKGYNP